LYELANTHPYQSEGGSGGEDLEGEYEDDDDDEDDDEVCDYYMLMN
jgi:hypothetical protein